MFVVINLIMGFLESVGAVVTQESALNRGTVMQAAMAGSKVRLGQTPTVVVPNTTRAALEAVEATYDGYTAGGNVITAWGPPLLSSGGGAAISAETTFAYVDASDHTANTLTCGWVEGGGGGMYFGFNLPNPITLAANGQGFVLQLMDTEGADV